MTVFRAHVADCIASFAPRDLTVARAFFWLSAVLTDTQVPRCPRVRHQEWVLRACPRASRSAKLQRMTTPFTPVELAHLETHLPRAISRSMLDGYLTAVSSGPSFVMPDQVLRWVWDAGRADQLTTDQIIRQCQAVNDTLNDRVYAPVLTDQQAWCRGYLAGFVADMTAWAPMTAALPDLLKVILSNAQDQPLDSAKAALAEAAHRIHAFWLSQRRHGSNADGLLGQLAAFSPTQAVLPNQ